MSFTQTRAGVDPLTGQRRINTQERLAEVIASQQAPQGVGGGIANAGQAIAAALQLRDAQQRQQEQRQDAASNLAERLRPAPDPLNTQDTNAVLAQTGGQTAPGTPDFEQPQGGPAPNPNNPPAAPEFNSNITQEQARQGVSPQAGGVNTTADQDLIQGPGFNPDAPQAQEFQQTLAQNVSDGPGGDLAAALAQRGGSPVPGGTPGSQQARQAALDTPAAQQLGQQREQAEASQEQLQQALLQNPRLAEAAQAQALQQQFPGVVSEQQAQQRVVSGQDQLGQQVGLRPEERAVIETQGGQITDVSLLDDGRGQSQSGPIETFQLPNGDVVSARRDSQRAQQLLQQGANAVPDSAAVPETRDRDFEATTVQLPNGQRVQGRIDESSGRLQVLSEDGQQFVNAPRGATTLDQRLQGSEEDVGIAGRDLSPDDRVPQNLVNLFPDRLGRNTTVREANQQGFNVPEQKRIQELQDTQAATINTTRTLETTRQLVREGGEAALGFTGRIGAALNALGEEAEALVDAGLVDLDEGESVSGLQDASRFDSTFQKIGITNNRVQSRVLSAAFAIASAEQDRISDQDIRTNIERVGKSSDPESFAATLSDVSRSLREKFESQSRAIVGKPSDVVSRAIERDLFGATANQLVNNPDALNEALTMIGSGAISPQQYRMLPKRRREMLAEAGERLLDQNSADNTAPQGSRRQQRRNQQGDQ